MLSLPLHLSHSCLCLWCYFSNTWVLDKLKRQTLSNPGPTSSARGKSFLPNFRCLQCSGWHLSSSSKCLLQTLERICLTLALFIQCQSKQLGWMICPSDLPLLCSTADSRHLVRTSRAHLPARRHLVQADALKHPPRSSASNMGGDLCPVGPGSHIHQLQVFIIVPCIELTMFLVGNFLTFSPDIFHFFPPAL